MRQDCPECQRLWREYATATRTHIGLEKKLRLLAPGSASDKLARDVASAATVRETARQTIHEHEVATHGGAAEVADGNS